MVSTPTKERNPASNGSSCSILDELNLEYAGSDDLTRLAAQMLERGEYSNAEDLLRQALSLNPEHRLCRAYLAICVAHLGRNDGSPEAMARALVDEERNDPAGWFALGHLDLMAGRRGAAFAHFHHARELARRDRRLQAAIDRQDPRCELTFRSLPRDHPLNTICGQLRAMFRMR